MMMTMAMSLVMQQSQRNGMNYDYTSNTPIFSISPGVYLGVNPAANSSPAGALNTYS